MGQYACFAKWLHKSNHLLILSVNVSIVAIALFSNALAVCSLLSIVNLSICLFLMGAVFCFYFKDYLLKISMRRISSSGLLLILFIVLLGVLYGYYKIMPFGIGRDPSLYFLEGIHISKTGGIKFPTDLYISENYEKLRNIIDLSYAGLYSGYEYGLSENPGYIVPQFLHMFPSMLSIGFSLGGIQGLQMVNPLISMCSATMIYVFVDAVLGNKKAALIAMLFCALNPAQVYSARITQSEILCQLIFFLGMYLYSYGWKNEKKEILALSGVCVGLMNFNRIDMHIMGCGIFILTLYYIWFEPKIIKLVKYFFMGYTFVSILSIIYSYVFSYPYFKDHWDMGVLSSLLICNLILLFLVFISMLLKKRFFYDLKSFSIFEFLFSNYYAEVILILVLITFSLFAYFIRPAMAITKGIVIDADRFHANALVEFCFYTSFISLFLALYGIWKLTYKVEKKRWECYLMWAVLSFCNLFIYLFRPSIASDHIWASRRWITVCIPLVLIFAAYGICFLSFKKLGAFIQFFIVSVILAYMLFQGRGFLTQNIGGNILAEYKVFSEKLQEDTIYFSEDKWAVTLLREVFDKKNVFRLKSSYVYYLDDYLEEEQEFYLIGNLPNAVKNNSRYLYQKIVDSYIYSNELERSYGRIPVEIKRVIINTPIFCVTNNKNKDLLDFINYDSNNSIPYIYDLQDFSSNTGIRSKNEIVSHGEEGYICYGPYATLDKGTYYASMKLTVPPNSMYNIGFFEVSKNQSEVINRMEINLSDLVKNEDAYVVSLPFSLEEKSESIEYRFYAYNGSLANVKEINVLQTSDVFTVGLDDSLYMSQITDALDKLNISTAAYLTNAEDNISLEYFSQRLNTYNLDKIYAENIGENKPDAIIASIRNDSWLKVLDKYKVVDRFGKNLLLLNEDFDSHNSIAATLSNEMFVDMSVFNRESNRTYTVGEYETIYPGAYTLKLQFETEDLSNLDVCLLDGSKLLESQAAIMGNQIIVTFEKEWAMDAFSINVSDQNGEKIIPEWMEIRQRENLEELNARKNLEPHFRIIKLIEGDYKKENVFIVQEDIIYESLQNYDYIIAPKYLDFIFDMMENNFIMINTTDRYVLLAKNNNSLSDKVEEHGLKILGKDTFISYNYFYDTAKATSPVNLPKGTYEIMVKVKLKKDSTLPAEFNDCKLSIADNKEILKEEFLKLDFSANENYLILPIMISRENSMENIKVKLEVPNSLYNLQYSIDGIRRVSDGVIINVSDLYCLSGEYTSDGIYAKSVNENMIYGPYIDLPKGNYTAIITYSASSDAGLHFDVSANKGTNVLKTASATESRTKENWKFIEMPFTVTDETKQIEIRTFIPSNTEFLLQKIEISWANDQGSRD